MEVSLQNFNSQHFIFFMFIGTRKHRGKKKCGVRDKSSLTDLRANLYCLDPHQ